MLLVAWIWLKHTLAFLRLLAFLQKAEPQGGVEGREGSHTERTSGSPSCWFPGLCRAGRCWPSVGAPSRRELDADAPAV